MKDKNLVRIILGAVLFFIASVFLKFSPPIQLAVFLIAYLILGLRVLLNAISNIAHGQVFDENFLMSIATVGAFLIGDYPEAVVVMLFFKVGEYFEHYAVGKSRDSISSLMDLRPDFANVLRGDEYVQVSPEEVIIGDTIMVKPGERIPLDGVVLSGLSAVDTSSLTGESMPREIEPGMSVLSGCININGLLTINVMKEYGESTVAKILDLVENASNEKAESENFITKFARYYTPIVVIIAVFLAIIPPIVVPGATFATWVYRALVFLVISCPCALVISVPLSFFGGIGGASKHGILIKGSNYLEALSKADSIVFDKTGTLTCGTFNVVKINAIGIDENDLLEFAAHAESFSSHPIAVSLRNAYKLPIDDTIIGEVMEYPGHGVATIIKNHSIAIGNAKLMNKLNINFTPIQVVETVVHIAVDNIYAGYILIADELKPDAISAITDLKKCGIKETTMLTGDTKWVAESVAQKLGLDNVFYDLLPTDKVTKFEEFLKSKTTTGHVVYVGDGINDAPVLARADIGIAMGGLGSDAAIEAADIVIMTDEPSKIVEAIKISRKTLGIVRQNIIFAIVVKIVVLILGAVGIANMWTAVFADVGVSVLAILNAMRALK